MSATHEPGRFNEGTRLHEILEEINAAGDLTVEQHKMEEPHAYQTSDHNPDPPQPKAAPVHVGPKKPRILALPDGKLWVSKGRVDNPPPNIDPDKWFAMSRKDRRAFAARANRLR